MYFWMEVIVVHSVRVKLYLVAFNPPKPGSLNYLLAFSALQGQLLSMILILFVTFTLFHCATCLLLLYFPVVGIFY